MSAKQTTRQLTTGVHDFESLVRDETKKYVDKTDLLFKLAESKTDAQYFISRPRRFGKSLMLSTLQAMFEGRRELFKGLAIDKEEWECWEEYGNNRYPVYNFSMSEANGATLEMFYGALRKLTIGLLGKVGLEYDDTVDPSANFDAFIKAATAKSPTKQIVILIDEYDEPVAGFLDDIDALKRIRKLLHDFYEKLKTNSVAIRFLMMTGVTKLTKLSVFSGMNHLTDISMDSRYATLLGYTEEELDGTLRENVEEFGAKHGWDFKAAKTRILEWYDGYRFSPGSEARVVNPVSIGKLFGSPDGELKSYWETTGSASLVFNRLKASGKLPADLENVRVRPIQLDVCDAETLPVESLLYQSGYLTIKENIPSPNEDEKYAEAYNTYRLGPPNLEVREALKNGYVSKILKVDAGEFDILLDRAKHLIASGEINEVVETMLFSLYASVPPDWRIKDEAEAKRYFLLFFAMLGADPAPEFPSARGYADAVVQRPDAVYVFEFKYDRSAEEAIRQIKERNYAAKWLAGPRPVTLIGINFNPAIRNIDMPVVELA